MDYATQIMGSKVFGAAMKSLMEPAKTFIETGFFTLPPQDDNAGVMPEPQIRRIIREIAKELRRPFIQFQPVYSYWDQVNGWKRRDEPLFSHYYVEIPRKKYLQPLAAPFFMGDRGSAYYSKYVYAREAGKQNDKPDIIDHTCVSLWRFVIRNRALGEEIYSHLLVDPDMRRIRRIKD